MASDHDGVVIGGFVQLVLPPPGAGVPDHAWYWAYVVGPDVGVVAVRDHEVPRPRGGALAVRADGLWAELVCETPDLQWTIGLEAFGVRLEHPVDALRGEVGERIAVGLDLEWDEGAVFGDVLIGTGRVAFDGVGVFRTADGAPTWRTTPGLEATLDADGLPEHLVLRSAANGDVVTVEMLAVVVVPFATGAGAHGGARHLVRVLGRRPCPDG